MKRLLFILAAGALVGQDKLPNASISGVVRDASTGQPLAKYSVYSFQGKGWESTTDESGRYRLADIPAGSFQFSARAAERFGSETTKRVTLAGRDLDGIDFRIVVEGSISGKVIDEYKEPVPDAFVHLVSKEYFLGTVVYYFRASARTDDRGQYTLTQVAAGHPYLIVVDRFPGSLQAHSDAPLDPKLRRRVLARTWYPNSPDKDSATTILIQTAEHREAVDIQIKKSPSYCIAGTLEGPKGPAELRFNIEALQPSSGISHAGGSYVAFPHGSTGSDGKFRICDLTPGSYRFTAIDRPSGSGLNPEFRSFVATNLTITDRDLQGLKFTAGPGVPLEGEVVLDGPTPEEPLKARLNIWLQPLLRTTIGENSSARPDIPGSFSFPSLPLDDYAIRVVGVPRGLYVKDITYAGRSIKDEVLHFGSAMPGAGLRVVVERDGGTLNASVADKDGNPLSDMHVILFPDEIPSEAAFAERVSSGLTDQAGQYQSAALAPGKYYIGATKEGFDFNVERVSRLWRSRNRFQEVNIPSGAPVSIRLEPATLE